MIDEMDTMRYDAVIIWPDNRLEPEMHRDTIMSKIGFQTAIPFRTASAIIDGDHIRYGRHGKCFGRFGTTAFLKS